MFKKIAPLKTIHNLYTRAQNRHYLELVKFIELEVMGRFASTYCYHHPSHVLVELTTRCNLRCKWCNQSNQEWREKFGNQEMDFSIFEKIVPQLQKSQVILLYNIGEPLLYSRIFDAIRLAKTYIPEVRITSNTVLLTPKTAKNLEDAGLTQLNVSIDSPDPEFVKQIRGISIDKIKNTLIEFGQNCKIPVEIWTVISSGNIDSLPMLPEWASHIPAVKSLYFQLQNGVSQGDSIGLPVLNSKIRFEELKEKIGRRCCELGITTNIESLPYYLNGFQQKEASGICKAPFTQLAAINVKGQLVPCCSYATYNLGDVSKERFEKVWNGPKMRAWRKDMLNQHYCSYCAEWCGYRQEK